MPRTYSICSRWDAQVAADRELSGGVSTLPDHEVDQLARHHDHLDDSLPGKRRLHLLIRARGSFQGIPRRIDRHSD